MKQVSCAVFSLMLWSCGPASLPAPSIVSVVPEQVVQGDSSALSVKVSAVLPFSVDYEDQSAQPLQSAVTVQLAGQAVDVPFASADGTLIVPVPTGLELGAYDIRVALEDGRDAQRDRAFSVVLPSTLAGRPGDPDDPASEATVGFQIDPIGEQVRDVPFKVTVRATGSWARGFHEPLSMRASQGQVVTVTPGVFTEGVRVEEISLSHPGARVYLMLEDASGNRWISNPFHVRPY